LRERAAFCLQSWMKEKIRKAIAGVIIKCAREKTKTLAGMTEAARQAVAILITEASDEPERPQHETSESPSK